MARLHFVSVGRGGRDISIYLSLEGAEHSRAEQSKALRKDKEKERGGKSKKLAGGDMESKHGNNG